MGIAIGIGLLAGVLGGMLGVGGGVIVIPGMVLTHYRHQNVKIKTALLIIPAAVVFSFVGGMAADRLDASILRIIVGGIIILVGFFMVIKGWRTEG
jgi:uncharacterized membrane protein YfcA